MDRYEKSLRVGLSAILCALLVRLSAGALATKVTAFLARPDTAAFLLYLETGRNVRSSLSEEAQIAFSPQSAEPVPQETMPPETIRESEPPAEREPTEAQEAPEEGSEAPVAFTREDAEGITMYYACGLRPDIKALLLAPVELTPPEEGPRVLIYSTHSTESYTRSGEVYAESADYRTLDQNYNMLSVGSFVARQLEEMGIQTLVDGTFHDYPSYNAAYAHARKSVKEYLAEYPSIQLVLDLHRDASDSGNGQLRTLAVSGGEDCAQLMLVMGTDAAGLKHDRWQENLSLALKLQVLLERLCPGITRPVCLRAQRFNQDLSPGCLLVEIGAAGNTRAEALKAAGILARAVGMLLENAEAG